MTSTAFPVSVKGVVVRANRVLLLRNERDEWELPGGRIEIWETPEECVAREIREETGWTVSIGPILDSWMYHIGVAPRHVFIVTYGCRVDTDAEPVLSGEHRELGLFGLDETARLRMPAGYRRSIASWFVRLST